MSGKKVEDYSKVQSAKNVQHVVDEDGKGWFCYCGQSDVDPKAREGCCSPEGGADFERVG